MSTYDKILIFLLKINYFIIQNPKNNGCLPLPLEIHCYI